LNKRI